MYCKLGFFVLFLFGKLDDAEGTPSSCQSNIHLSTLQVYSVSILLDS